MRSGTRNRSFGKRRDQQMAIVARDPTDQDSVELAAYYGRLL
jgi:cytochrome c553